MLQASTAALTVLRQLYEDPSFLALTVWEANRLRLNSKLSEAVQAAIAAAVAQAVALFPSQAATVTFAAVKTALAGASSAVDFNGQRLTGLGAGVASTDAFTVGQLAAPGAIGGTTPGSGAFTTLAASGSVTGAGFTALFASPPSIGSSAPGTGAFTTMSVSTLNGNSVPTPAATGSVLTTDNGGVQTPASNLTLDSSCITKSSQGGTHSGRVTLVAGVATVAATWLTANSVIIPAVKTPNPGAGDLTNEYAALGADRTNGVGFIISAVKNDGTLNNLDTSVVDWIATEALTG